MRSSAPNGPNASALPPFDGTSAWFEQLPVRAEAVVRVLLRLAPPPATHAPASPEDLQRLLGEEDEAITVEDVIECLLLLHDAGFLRLVSVPSAFGATDLAELHPLARNIPETHGWGVRERGRAREGASASERGRPAGNRRQHLDLPPQFCPDHMPHGTDKDCWACGRRRETRAAVAKERRDEARRRWEDDDADRS